MKLILKHPALTILVLLSLSSCSSGGDSDSAPEPNPTPTNITYNNTISSVIASNCISCHGVTPTSGASISLDTYTKVKTAVQNNDLIQRISYSQGNSNLMPKNGTRLPQTTIDKFTTWKNNSYPE